MGKNGNHLDYFNLTYSCNYMKLQLFRSETHSHWLHESGQCSNVALASSFGRYCYTTAEWRKEIISVPSGAGQTAELQHTDIQKVESFQESQRETDLCVWHLYSDSVQARRFTALIKKITHICKLCMSGSLA